MAVLGVGQGIFSEGALIKTPALSEVLSSLALLRFYRAKAWRRGKYSLSHP